MVIVLDDIIGATVFTVIGGILGMFLLFVGAIIAPRMLNALTPKIDEEKEIARGNVAVAQYFGRLAEGVIIGLSIIVAAAIIAGIHGW